MEVQLNHTKTEIKSPCSLQEFLNLQNLANKKGIAVAVNNKVIQRTNWDTHNLQANDNITIIKATQGG